MYCKGGAPPQVPHAVISRIKRRSSAIHREEKKADVERQKKLGLI